jgi:hypothetical protein
VEKKAELVGKLYDYWQSRRTKDALWKTNRKLDQNIFKILVGIIKEFSEEDISIWIGNYIKDIEARNKSQDYSKHRFTLQEFFTQKNWFRKFYNINN